MIGQPWRTLLVAACFVGAGFGAGWTVNGWRLGAELASAKSDHDEVLRRITAESSAALQAANNEAAAHRAVIAKLDIERIQRDQAHEIEVNNLRIAVDAGARKLRVRASCPSQSGAGMPAATGAARMDASGPAELDPSARQDYFALRSGILELESELKACKRIALAKTE